MRPLRAAAVIAVCALLTLVGGTSVTSAAAAPPAGTFTKHTFAIGGVARDYWVYVPSTPASEPRPLVVYLHGCNQRVEHDAAPGTRWNALAERRGFVVAYPEQRINPQSNGLGDGNGIGCWNWFLPDHQNRNAGEPALIAGITRQVVADQGLDPSRVYVAGVSAGADMTAILGATYPDVYAAIAPFAGCAYLTCADVSGTAAFAAMGPRARVVPAMVVQGTVDALNNFGMGETLVSQQLGTNDLADDGLRNSSVPLTPTSTEHVGFDATLADNLGTIGDTCVRSRQFPCAGALAGLESYPYSIERHADTAGCSVVDFWIVHGLGHDYPYGDPNPDANGVPRATFIDQIGPDITTASYDFFTKHRLGAPPCGGAPAPVVPESPVAIAVPLLALALVGGVAVRRRASQVSASA